MEATLAMQYRTPFHTARQLALSQLIPSASCLFDESWASLIVVGSVSKLVSITDRQCLPCFHHDAQPTTAGGGGARRPIDDRLMSSFTAPRAVRDIDLAAGVTWPRSKAPNRRTFAHICWVRTVAEGLL